MSAYRWEPPLPSKMPHLEGAMGLEGPRGMCFHRSVGFVLDVPGSVLRFGTFRAATEEEQRAIGPLASKVPFIHCWAEWHGAAWAPSTIESQGRLGPMRPTEYYAANGARDLRTMHRPQLLALAREHGFRRHLIRHKPLIGDASFGTLLLAAAGIEWQETPEGGVIPKGEVHAAA